MGVMSAAMADDRPCCWWVVASRSLRISSAWLAVDQNSSSLSMCLFNTRSVWSCFRCGRRVNREARVSSIDREMVLVLAAGGGPWAAVGVGEEAGAGGVEVTDGEEDAVASLSALVAAAVVLLLGSCLTAMCCSAAAMAGVAAASTVGVVCGCEFLICTSAMAAFHCCRSSAACGPGEHQHRMLRHTPPRLHPMPQSNRPVAHTRYASYTEATWAR